MELPVSACLKELFIIPKNKGGFSCYSFKTLTEKMRLVKRSTLHHSANEDVNLIWSETQNRFIDTDCVLLSTRSKTAATKLLKDKQNGSAELKRILSLFLCKAHRLMSYLA